MKTCALLVVPLAALLLHCGCASVGPPASGSFAVTLENVLERMPPHDTLEAAWLFSQVVQMGPDSVVELCSRLGPEGSERNARSEFALQGVAEYVVSRGKEPERLVFVSALGRALGKPMPPRQASFILGRLQVAGRSESISTLSRFLLDTRLCEPAAQAMVAIRDGAESMLLSALPDAGRSCRVTILKSLGDLRATGAVSALLREAASDDPEVRRVAMYGLANIGDPRAESVLATGVTESLTRDRDEYLSYQLLFARRRLEAGDSAVAISFGSRLLTGDSLSRPDHVRAAALELLIRAKRERAVEDLLHVMADTSLQLRSAALEGALHIPGEQTTRRWVAALKDARPEVRAGIVSMLGRRGDATAYPAVLEALHDSDGRVRASAMDAAVRLENTQAAAPLLAHLQRSEEPGDVMAARRALERLPADQLIPPAVESLPRLTPGACVMVLGLLARYGTMVPAQPVRTIAEKEKGDVRLAAVRTLGSVAREDAEPVLIDILVGGGSDDLVEMAQKSLAMICLRGDNPEARADHLLDAYEHSGPDGRRLLLPVIGRVGGRRGLATVAGEIRGSYPDLRYAAVRALADWPTIDAYDTLLSVATRREKLTLRVLALRGCVRVVENAQISPALAALYHERTLAAAERADEKRLALGALANLRTVTALKAVVPFIDNDSLGLDAAMAADRIATGKAEAKDELGPTQVARVFIASHLPARYLSRVERAFETTSGMNTPPEGFRALFNGRNLEGWKGLVENPIARSRMSAAELAWAQARADSVMRAHWSVVDGVLEFDGKGESLCTAEDFGDFELMVDWKIGKHGDSGIYLRGSPQVQIWDPTQWPEGSGGLYNNQKNPSKPLLCADNPVGEWNTFRIRMVGDRVTVHLNNILVVDSVMLENYWDRSIPIFPTGQIELQSHNSPLAFRNIYVREIPRRKPLVSGPLFNGTDLTGWTVVNGSEHSWGAADGILYTTGEGGGWLSTNQEYDNFQLDLDFRVQEGGNSGIFLRSPRKGDPAFTGMEIQVLDDYSPEYANLQPWQYCGSLYGVVAASRRASRRANEWQHYRIVACGPRVTVLLNDQTIVDADLIAHMDRESTHPGLKRRSGFIGLQSHTLKVEYRNITLTELEWREDHDGD